MFPIQIIHKLKLSSELNSILDKLLTVCNTIYKKYKMHLIIVYFKFLILVLIIFLFI